MSTRVVQRKSERSLADGLLKQLTIQETINDILGTVTKVSGFNLTDRAAKLYLIDDVNRLEYVASLAPGRSAVVNPRFAIRDLLKGKGHQIGLNYETSRAVPGSVGVPSELANNSSSSYAATLLVPGTGSVSPTANALLVVIGSAGAFIEPAHDITGITDTFTGTSSWTAIQNVTSGQDDNSERCHEGIWWAKAGSSPGSGTITITWAGSLDNRVGFLLEIAGTDTSTPVSESSSANQVAGTTMSISLTSIAGDNRSVGGVMTDTSSGNIVPGSNETEGTEISVDTYRAQWQYGTNAGDDTPVNWTGLGGGEPPSLAAAGVAVEIAAAAAVGNPWYTYAQQ